MRCFLTVNRAVLSTLFCAIDGIAFFVSVARERRVRVARPPYLLDLMHLQVGDVTFFLLSAGEVLSSSCLPPYHVIGVIERLGEVFA